MHINCSCVHKDNFENYSYSLVQNFSSSGVTCDVQKTKTYKTIFYLLLIVLCGCESWSVTVMELENIRT
jgi:hypothetical protein